MSGTLFAGGYDGGIFQEYLHMCERAHAVHGEGEGICCAHWLALADAQNKLADHYAAIAESYARASDEYYRRQAGYYRAVAGGERAQARDIRAAIRAGTWSCVECTHTL